MSISICTRCLLRLRLSSLPSISAVGQSSFHTSTTQYMPEPMKKKGAAKQVKFRESRGATIKKKRKERPRPPPVGERRTARKRIVLSNTNAFDVPGLEALSVENMADPGRAGDVLSLEGPLLDQLRYVKAFKTTQNWNMFRKPSTLVRQETAELGMDIEDVKSSTQMEGSQAKTIQRMITGPKQVGKSILLAQAMSMAFLNKWVVINVPEAQDYTINQSAYSPVPAPEHEEQLYVQPTLTSDLLSRTADANSAVLSSLPLTHDHTASKLSLDRKMSLKDLALLGAEDASLAWPVWLAFWKELTAPAPAAAKSNNKSSPSPPPVLLAVDGIDHWMGLTKYRSSDYQLLHAQQFLFIRHVTSLLFSPPAPHTTLASGGLILGATSASNSPSFTSFNLLLEQIVAREAGISISDPDFPVPESYQVLDPRVMHLFRGSEGLDVQQLKGLSRKEARGLLEYFARSGLFTERVTEEQVGEKWALSGGGVVGEMARFGKRVRI